MSARPKTFIVHAQMTTDLVLKVQAPEGTDEDTIRALARNIDGGCFTDVGGLSGGWQITDVTQQDDNDPVQTELEAYDLAEELAELRTTAIRDLNDRFRKNTISGKVILTEGITALDEADAILSRVAAYDDFDEPENDPYREHDFGSFDYTDQGTGSEHKIMWKIDYYHTDMKHLSEDPTNPVKTMRVLTVMLAEEY